MILLQETSVPIAYTDRFNVNPWKCSPEEQSYTWAFWAHPTNCHNATQNADFILSKRDKWKKCCSGIYDLFDLFIRFF